MTRFDRLGRVMAAESLEARTMLSISAAAEEPPIGQVRWNGHEADAYLGRWIVGVDDAAIVSLASALGAGAPAAADAQSAGGMIALPAAEVVKSWLTGNASTDSLSVLRSLGTAGKHRMFELATPAETRHDELRSMLADLPGFRYVEPDFVLTADVTTPNDPQYPSLWGMNNTGQTGGTPDADIDVPEAWDLTTGSSEIVVGVIDTGVDYNHVDLAANMWTNPAEIPGDGIDNDGNGFIDDIHGWDFANDDNDPMDDRNHGTHVSGTIGAVGNNGEGVAGVNWNVQIMALKFLRETGSGATSDAVDALNYATMMRRDHGINVRMTSNSWGGGGYSQALYDAIAASRDENMLFIAAAGNGGSDGVGDNTDAIPHYPSTYDLDNIISVASTNHNDVKAGSSNFGAVSVDLSGPGVSVRSTVRGNNYANFSGTSMATPHVAGVAALAWSIAPDESYQTIRDAIFAGVDPIPAMNGISVTGGRLNALGALEQLGMRVISTTPARGEVISDLRTDFTIRFTDAYDPASVSASDLLINGHAADSFTLDTDTLTFHYLSSPIESQGLQTITLADGAILRDGDFEPLHAYTGTFCYDALPMAVTATVPADGTIATLPLITLQVDFNEPFDPATIGIDDVVLSQGTVRGFTPVGNSVIYDVSGIVDEVPLSLSFKGGALRDIYGNPLVAYAGGLTLDYGLVPLPTPLAPVEPHGSLVYDPPLFGSIGFGGDVDSFAIYLAAGQALTVVADPDAALQGTLELRDPSNVPVASATAAAAGSDVVLQTVVAATSGTHQISLAGSGGTTGGYTLEATLNAAVESESHDGAANNTFGTAQNLNAGFTSLGSHGTLAALLGRTDAATDDWFAFDLTMGARATLVLENRSGGNVDLALAEPGGSVAETGVAGATNADEMIHQFVAPASGTYFARVSGDPDADYTLLVLRGAEFDTEPNDSPGGALVDLSHVHHALGFLQLERPAFTDPVAFSIDEAQSSITLAPNVEGIPFSEQSPGSLTTNFEGSIVAMVEPGTIQFTGSSAIDAIAQPGPFLPGNAPADYAMQLDLSPIFPGVIAYFATRDVVLNVTSGVAAVDPAGQFSAGALTFAFTDGSLDYTIGPLGSGSVPLAGVTFSNDSPDAATLEEVNGVLHLSIPLVASESFIEPGTGLQFNFDFAGVLVGALVLPSPIDPVDHYEVTLGPGEHLVVSTETPFDGPGAAEPNTLDPALELLDQFDAVVTDDADSAADGKNALVAYTSPGGGTYKIRVQSTAGGGEYVLSVNRAPVLELIGDHALDEGSTLAFTAEAADPDLDQLVYSLGPGAPAGASIDPATGAFSWQPGDDTGGPLPITVIVTDNGNPQLSDSETFLVTVYNVAPIIKSANLRQSWPKHEKSVSLEVTFEDPGFLDRHTAVVDWGDGTSSMAHVNDAGQWDKFVANHVYASGGHYDVSFALTDDDGGTATGTESLIVDGTGSQKPEGRRKLQIGGVGGRDYVILLPDWGERLDVFSTYVKRIGDSLPRARRDPAKTPGLGINSFESHGSRFGRQGADLRLGNDDRDYANTGYTRDSSRASDSALVELLEEWTIRRDRQ